MWTSVKKTNTSAHRMPLVKTPTAHSSASVTKDIRGTAWTVHVQVSAVQQLWGGLRCMQTLAKNDWSIQITPALFPTAEPPVSPKTKQHHPSPPATPSSNPNPTLFNHPPLFPRLSLKRRVPPSKAPQLDCSAHYQSGRTTSGVYCVDPDGKGAFPVYCDMTTDGGGWTVFQRRRDGSQDFYLGWNEYKAGFGQVNDEFWLGLDKIHRLTASRPSELRVEVGDWSGGWNYAKYGSFVVGDEQSLYQLSVGSYSGTAGDSLARHNNMKFSTKDRDNDQTSANCAVSFTGAWWYNSCYHSNLNRQYLGNKKSNKGVNWRSYKNNWLSLKFAEMELRPTN